MNDTLYTELNPSAAPALLPVALGAAGSPADPEPSAPVNSPAPPDLFPRLPGETPRAYGAFLVYYDLGHSRSHAAVADRLGEQIDTVKTWSSRYQWSHRITAFQSSLLQQQVAARLALHQDQAADWVPRTRECREHEWETARQLRDAAQ